jgi:hypothetical protein
MQLTVIDSSNGNPSGSGDVGHGIAEGHQTENINLEENAHPVHNIDEVVVTTASHSLNRRR